MIYQGNLIPLRVQQQQHQQQMQGGDLHWAIQHRGDQNNDISHFLSPLATATATAQTSNSDNLSKTPLPLSSGWPWVLYGSASQLSSHHYDSFMTAAPSNLLEAHQFQHCEQQQEHLKRSTEQPMYHDDHSQSSMRIGLDLGGRTYFSTEDNYWQQEKEVILAARRLLLASKRPRLVDHDQLDFLASSNSPVAASASQHLPAPLCQALGCRADLSTAKHYHRRHKVCEMHSKASTVTAANGQTQRFCQQCSRFHALAEFDEGKRSCRKRLADHNRRRRKPPPRAAPNDENHEPCETCKDPADLEISKHNDDTTTGTTSRSTEVVEEETE